MLAGLADRVIVAADHTKFDHKKAMVLGPLDLIDWEYPQTVETSVERILLC
jgi:DeoR/GlpR family transcriptional regulator of sugar metabolism